MSRYLGIEPVNGGPYYFISYNSEDVDRVSAYAKIMARYNIPMWYDHGLKTGCEWQEDIANHIQNCEGVILFLTKKIFAKEQSFVYTEYEMAKNYFDKKMYIILLDEFDKKDIPNKYLSWWIEIQHIQSISCLTEESFLNSMERVMEDIGYSNDPRINLEKIRKKIEELDEDHRKVFIEEYLQFMSRNEEISAKAKFYAELVCSGALRNSRNDDPSVFGTGDKIIIGNTELLFLERDWHCSRALEPTRIEVYQNGQGIFLINYICEGCVWHMYYDKKNNQLFVCYKGISYHEADVYEAALERGEDYDYRTDVGVLIIEDPANAAKCYLFKDLVIL